MGRGGAGWSGEDRTHTDTRTYTQTRVHTHATPHAHTHHTTYARTHTTPHTRAHTPHHIRARTHTHTRARGCAHRNKFDQSENVRFETAIEKVFFRNLTSVTIPKKLKGLLGDGSGHMSTAMNVMASPSAALRTWCRYIRDVCRNAEYFLRNVREKNFYNSAITKPVVCARIVVEMGSHLKKKVPIQSHNSFLDQSHCVISQEPFLCSVRTLSSLHLSCFELITSSQLETHLYRETGESRDGTLNASETKHVDNLTAMFHCERLSSHRRFGEKKHSGIASGRFFRRR